MGGAASSLTANVEEITKLENLPEGLRGKVYSQVEDFLTDIVAKYAESEAFLTVYRAANLAKTDTRSESDPYVAISLTSDGWRDPKAKIVCTSKVRNTSFPTWEKGLGETIKVGPASASDLLLVEVYDCDGREPDPTGTVDDLLGSILLPLEDPLGTHGMQYTADLQVQTHDGFASAGNLTFSFGRTTQIPALSAGASIKDMVLSFFELIPEWIGSLDNSNSRDLRQECIRTLQVILDTIEHAGGTADDIHALFSKQAGFPTIFHRVHQAILDKTVEELQKTLRPVSEQAEPKAEQIMQQKQQQQQPVDGDSEPVRPESEKNLPESVPSPVVRKEIRTMPQEEQLRFVNAVKKLMESDTPGGSEWLRIAGYHGWPSNEGEGYCVHRAEAFPGWHRAYLIELEEALRKADRELGNDGNIGVPYWDFSVLEINGQVMPSIIREHFTEGFSFPENFFPEDPKLLEMRGVDKFRSEVFSRVSSEEKLRRKMIDNAIEMKSAACLDLFANADHWQHASMENKSGVSVEDPHNNAHVCLGFPLTSLKFAAFHPMFWLLHCNTDRQYEKYLELAGRENCLREIINHQKIRQEGGAPNLYLQDSDPFKRPTHLDEILPKYKGRGFTLADAVAELYCLGYSYDKLPPRPKQQMRELPTVALFKDVDVSTKLRGADGLMKTFDMHIFVCEKGKTDTLRSELSKSLENLRKGEISEETFFKDHANYAGIVSLFGGKGPNCANCKVNRTINASLLLNNTLAKLGNLSRFDVDLVTVAEDEFGEYVFFEDIQETFGAEIEIPAPIVTGPLFESSTPDLHQVDGEADLTTQTKEETRKVQQVLAQQGYYTGAVDGQFGPVTDQAIKDFQKYAGIKDDGIIGPVTKATLTQTRFDGHRDVSEGDSKVFEKGQTIKYWIGTAPGYLDRNDVLAEAQQAFAQWESAQVFKFEHTDSREEATISITWNDHTPDNGRLFDGIGGEIARADSKGITLDVAERWTCKPRDANPRSFRLLAVLLHEIGHVLGLEHTPDHNRVLYPYYMGSRIKLSSGDASALATLYT